jgi:hypothetical protein
MIAADEAVYLGGCVIGPRSITRRVVEALRLHERTLDCLAKWH